METKVTITVDKHGFHYFGVEVSKNDCREFVCTIVTKDKALELSKSFDVEIQHK